MNARTALLAAAALAPMLAGCARTVVEQRLDTGYAAGDLDGEMNFWHSLPGRPAVSNEEGLHGLFLVADGRDATGGYEGRVAEARARGWLDAGFDEGPEMAMQRGTLSRGLVQICGIEGGLMMRLVGPIQRYALRELVYEGVMPPSSENQSISGLEYIGVTSKAQDYILLQQMKHEQEGAAEAARGQNVGRRTEQDAPSSGKPEIAEPAPGPAEESAPPR